MRVYYAHPIAFYNTNIEMSDVNLLLRLGFTVVNPKDLKLGADMDKYLAKVRKCDIVAFRPFEDNKIGSGVAMEISEALKHNIPVIEIPALSTLSSRFLTRNQTRSRLGLGPVDTEDQFGWSVWQ